MHLSAAFVYGDPVPEDHSDAVVLFRRHGDLAC
jgi:hypothetical protein